MANDNEANNKVTKWIRWTARILGTLIIVITLLITIGYTWNWVTTGVADPHAAENYPPIENLPPLFMLLSAVGLGIAWRWEGLGGAIAIVFQLAHLVVLQIHDKWSITQIGQNPGVMMPYFIVMIVAATGVLFLVCWWRSRTLGTTLTGA